MDKKIPIRKSQRLESFDYNSAGSYFITICTKDRKRYLSRIVGGGVLDAPQGTCLLPFGEIAKKYLTQLNDFYDNISVESFIIMPNHIHFILTVKDGTSRTPSPTREKQNSYVSCFVSAFKRFCNKEYGSNLWQRGFYDHIIRDEEDYNEHIKYISENPYKWETDELYINE